MRCLLLLALLTSYCALCAPLVAADGPKPPKFLRLAGIVGAHYPIEIDVQITPHPSIRWITVEAWAAEETHSPFANSELDVDPAPVYRVGAFASRSSSQPVTELMPKQRTFRFRWAQGLSEGVYFIVAKLATTNYTPIKETRKLVKVV